MSIDDPPYICGLKVGKEIVNLVALERMKGYFKNIRFLAHRFAKGVGSILGASASKKFIGTPSCWQM